MNLDKLIHIETSRSFSIPEFYTDIIETWLEIKNANKSPQIQTFDQIRKQILWGNQEIKYLRKSLYFQEWVKSNIIFVNDIINEKGVIAETVIYDKLINKSNWISQINQNKTCSSKFMEIDFKIRGFIKN